MEDLDREQHECSQRWCQITPYRTCERTRKLSSTTLRTPNCASYCLAKSLCLKNGNSLHANTCPVPSSKGNKEFGEVFTSPRSFYPAIWVEGHWVRKYFWVHMDKIARHAHRRLSVVNEVIIFEFNSDLMGTGFLTPGGMM